MENNNTNSIDDEQLVDKILNYPEIFDPKHSSYKLHTKKESIWLNIARELGATSSLCKKRWKNLKDNYYKHKKNTKKPTGSQGKGIRKRNPILENLKFLDSVEHERRILTNAEGENETDLIFNTDQIEQDEQDLEILESEVANAADGTGNKIVEKITLDEAPIRPQKRKRSVASEILTVIEKNNKEREALLSQLSLPPATDEDETDLLFKTFAKTMKKFPPLLKARTKNKIFKIISDAELELLESQSATRQSSSTNLFEGNMSLCTSSLKSATTDIVNNDWDQQIDNPFKQFGNFHFQ